jgi:hypothetical protein
MSLGIVTNPHFYLAAMHAHAAVGPTIRDLASTRPKSQGLDFFSGDYDVHGSSNTL